MGGQAGPAGAGRHRVQARADGVRPISVSAFDLLSLGAGLGGDLSGAGQSPCGPGGRRPAHGELRDLARHRGKAHLGHQRLRRGLSNVLCQRPRPVGDVGAPVDRFGDAGPHATRGVQCHPRGIPDVARARGPSVRPRRGPPRVATRCELRTARPGAVLDRDGRSAAGSPASRRGGGASEPPVP